MDENTRLLLEKASRPREWEDEEHSTYDQETLRQEFRKRLYAGNGDGSSTREQDQQADRRD